jgi:DNA-binding SARP family transcriptional activator
MAGICVFLLVTQPHQRSSWAFAGLAMGNFVFYLANVVLFQPQLSVPDGYLWQRLQLLGSDFAMIAAVWFALTLHESPMPRWVGGLALLLGVGFAVDAVWTVVVPPSSDPTCLTANKLPSFGCDPWRQVAMVILVLAGLFTALLVVRAAYSASGSRRRVLQRHLPVVAGLAFLVGLVNNVSALTDRFLVPSELPALLAGAVVVRMLILLEEEDLGLKGSQWGALAFVWLLAVVLAVIADQVWLPVEAPVLTMVAAGMGAAAGLAYLLRWLSQTKKLLAAPEGFVPAAEAQPAAARESPELIREREAATDSGFPSVRLYLLGPMRVIVEGRPLPNTTEVWRSAKTRSLLAYLALRGAEGASQAELVDALWPLREDLDGEAERRSLTALRSYLSTLRHVLEPSAVRGSDRYVELVDGRYRLRDNAGVWVDVWEFETLVGQGQRLLRQGESSGDLVCWQQVVTLYAPSGLLPGDTYLPIDFVEPRREQLRRHWLSGLRRLAEAEADDARAVEWWERLHQAEPLDQEATAWLARYYRRQGNASALRLMQRRRATAEA